MKKVLIYTSPVMAVYLSLGMAYGILMEQNGFGPVWSFFSSLIVFAGAAQYALVTLLANTTTPYAVFVFILIINARHLFYGISMLSRYKKTKHLKWYLMFGLTDETFGLLSATNERDLDNPRMFYLKVTILNHCYWILGSTLGGLLGTMISIQIEGLEFILVALFVSIFVSQAKKKHLFIPAFSGLILSFLSLLIFQNNFIIPSMIFIILSMLVLQGKEEMIIHE